MHATLQEEILKIYLYIYMLSQRSNLALHKFTQEIYKEKKRRGEEGMCYTIYYCKTTGLILLSCILCLSCTDPS